MKTRFFPTFRLLRLREASSAPQPTQPPIASQAPTQTPFPVAASRGPNLQATDPAAVSLASGQYQLVEFFRFT